MRRLFVLASTLSALAAPAHAEVGDQLAVLLNKARPVIVLSDTPDDPRVAAQIATLSRSGPALRERDVEVLREAKTGGALRGTLGVAEHGFAVVLVGKDGGVKKTWREPVGSEAIFAIIDAMPMRREEMRRCTLSFSGAGVCGRI